MDAVMEQVERNIRQRQLLRDGQCLLVATSGGLDSMVLLRVLHGLSPAHKWKLTVAHLNHRLRGRSSDADERLVRRTAKDLDLPIVSERADVREFGRIHGLSLEMAARQVRHEFLARTAKRLAIPAVAVAHHADDQLELFFLRLFRGSGGEGLGGMQWRNPSPADPRILMVRPLLDQPKAVLAQYAARNKVPFREDATNTLLDIQRNRIRHELLPLLRRKYQPALDRTLLRVMDILSLEAKFANQTAEEWLAAIAQTSNFDELPVAVQRRCLQRQLLDFGIPAEYDLIEELRGHAGRPIPVQCPPSHLSQTMAQESCRRAVPGSKAGPPTPPEQGPLCAVRDVNGLVRLQEAKQPEFRGGSLALNLGNRPGGAEFDGVHLRWRTIRSQNEPLPPEPGLELFDADQVGRRVVLRHWQPGDRFQPSGLATPVKLQDLFVNRKILRKQRHELIVGATAQGELFWVEGLRISERFKLTQRTSRRLYWRWKRFQSPTGSAGMDANSPG